MNDRELIYELRTRINKLIKRCEELERQDLSSFDLDKILDYYEENYILEREEE